MQLSDRSRGLIGAKELGLMKPTAYLINTSRGPIVDEKALLAALQGAPHRRRRHRRLRYREPLPLDHPFRKLDNIVITPHLGYVSMENYRLYFRDIVDDIRAFLDGKPVRSLLPRDERMSRKAGCRFSDKGICAKPEMTLGVLRSIKRHARSRSPYPSKPVARPGCGAR